MSRNDAEDFAQRLYARVPAHYRVYDAERGQPLLALLRVVGEQVANIRQDLDALWDNFFIETCDDWVVPYIGALVGTNLLAHPVGQSNRLDVWNTVIWRRSKGHAAHAGCVGAGHQRMANRSGRVFPGARLVAKHEPPAPGRNPDA